MTRKATNGEGAVSGRPIAHRLRSLAFQFRWELTFSLLFLAVTLFIFRDFFQHANPLGTDSMGLPFILTYSELSHDFFATWISYSGLGFPDYPLPAYQILYQLDTALGLSPLDIAKALMISAFWLTGVSMFVCSKRMTGNLPAAVVAALVFSFNQVILSQVIDGHYYFVLGYALFPFIFIIVHGILKERRTKFDILIPLILVAYGTLAPPNIVLIAALFLGLYALILYLMEPFPLVRLSKVTVSIVLIVAFLGLSVLLANNIPTYNTSYPIQEAMHWSSSSLTDALTLKASENSFFYGNETSAWVQSPALIPVANMAAYLVPVLAFSALLWKDRRREVLPLAIIAVIFIFTAKGPYEPLSGVFEWAYVNLPLLDTIRVFSRFSLFTGFAYGLLVAYFMAGLESRADLASPSQRLLLLIKRHKKEVIASMVIIIGGCLIVQSGAIAAGAVGTFDLSAEYKAPFDWVGKEEGDFRVLNLPYMADYHNGPSSYGYPNTTTIDPGIYSLMYTGKDTVYGSSTYDYWAFFDQAIDGKIFGYKEIPSILGASSSMRYIVVQTHTSSEERDAFLSMHNLTVVAEFEGGGMVLENDNWSPRATAFSNISLATGGRSMLTDLAGMGLFEPASEGLVFLDQLTPFEAEQLLNITDHIYIENGDLTELYMDLAGWSTDQSVMLYDLGTSQTTDETSHWIQGKWPLKAGLTLSPTLYTMGKCDVSFDVESEGAGSYMYLKLMRGPDAGTITISIPGIPDQTYDANYPTHQMAWVKFQMPAVTGPVKVTIANQGDGLSNLERLVVATDEEMGAQVERVNTMLADHLDKLVYIYPADSYFGDGVQVRGEDGVGVSNSGEGLNITVGNLLAGQERALVVDTNASDPASVTIQGDSALRLASGLDGSVFDLGHLRGGESIGISTNGTYGVAIFSGDWEKSAASTANVSYERLNSETYSVKVNGTGSLLLQISENYNSWWKGQADGGSILHVPVNSIVNGYLLKNGNTTVTVEYQGKATYLAIVGLLAVVLVATTALIVLKRYKSRKEGDDGM
ncbi:MAG: hypothetical protein SA339_01130 [Methanomassiliicoccus sp.]|nr:hypothetical protein [Methanomassiliicoccus sp.]